MKAFRIAGLALALALPAAPCAAAEAVNLILNWTPTADHSPFYYAKAQGWYEKAGIDLTIEVGKGSGVSSLKVGSGGSPFGIADLATMLVARSKGADETSAGQQLCECLELAGRNCGLDDVGVVTRPGRCRAGRNRQHDREERENRDELGHFDSSVSRLMVSGRRPARPGCPTVGMR